MFNTLLGRGKLHICRYFDIPVILACGGEMRSNEEKCILSIVGWIVIIAYNGNSEL